jgi:hypothetical protein
MKFWPKTSSFYFPLGAGKPSCTQPLALGIDPKITLSLRRAVRLLPFFWGWQRSRAAQPAPPEEQVFFVQLSNLLIPVIARAGGSFQPEAISSLPGNTYLLEIASFWIGS